jgi:signal transduction histidine kinase
MRERVSELEGKLRIVRPRRGGTAVRVSIPIRAASPGA